jgi:hypothetical protein
MQGRDSRRNNGGNYNNYGYVIEKELKHEHFSRRVIN